MHVKYTRQNMPCVIYSMLATFIIIFYIILSSHTSNIVRSAISSNKSSYNGITMHVYDVAVVYGIITLLFNLLMIGAVLFLLCVDSHGKLAYSIISLITVLWITYIVVAFQSSNNIND